MPAISNNIQNSHSSLIVRILYSGNMFSVSVSSSEKVFASDKMQK